jgi:uncharacterized membrane protein
MKIFVLNTNHWKSITHISSIIDINRFALLTFMGCQSSNLNFKLLFSHHTEYWSGTVIFVIIWYFSMLSRSFIENRFGALKSDLNHHFFRNACTKWGSLRFSQFSGCWLILSVYILMSFDFPFVRLFGVR